MKILVLFIALGAGLTGCVADKQKTTAHNPVDFCRSVGGEVKSVGNGAEQFCLLPDGDVVELQSFYNKSKNKK